MHTVVATDLYLRLWKDLRLSDKPLGTVQQQMTIDGTTKPAGGCSPQPAGLSGSRTRLAVQVEVEIHVQQVAEHVQADAPEGALVDGHPQHLAQAVQQAPAEAAW